MPRLDQRAIDWWKPKLRALDPWRQLELAEIEALYAERRSAPFEQLARSLADRPAEVKWILCGARGSGKSTELVRLAREVGDRFCVIETDLGIGLPEDGNTLAVVTILGVAALHAAEQWTSTDNSTALATTGSGGLPSRGRGLLDEALHKFGASVPGVADLITKIGSVVTLFSPVNGAVLMAAGATGTAASAGASRLRDALARGPLGGRLDPEHLDDARAVVEAVNAILKELEELAGRPPLLLVDGLDKRTSVEDVALALHDEHLLRDLDAALVLTGPVNLRHDPRFRAVPGNLRLSLLYNVPVREHDEAGKICFGAAGIAVLQDLYRRRQQTDELPEDLIGAPLVERAAQLSSGIVRDFLRLLYSSCENALEGGRRSVSREDLEAAIKAQRLEMQGYLDQGGIDTLARVLAKSMVPTTANADTLLFENFIACYPNSNLWYRPHELIVDFVDKHADRG